MISSKSQAKSYKVPSMGIQRFEDIIAWQKGEELTIFVYGAFKSCKDFAFRDQIQRASVSICANIAEGFERNTDKELRNFLYIAKGSAGEVRSFAHIAVRLGYISSVDYEYIRELVLEVSKIISGFIKKIAIST